MGKITNIRNEKQYLGFVGTNVCPNLFLVTEKTGLMSSASRWYCSATSTYMDSGMANNGCKRLNQYSCRYSSNIYPCRL